MNTERQESSQSKARGAKASVTTQAQVLVAWWAHHKSSCRGSLQRLLETPLQSLLTWMVIAIALALPSGLYLGLQNIQQLGHGWQDNAQMSVFLKRQAAPQAIAQVQAALDKDQDIASIETIAPGSALAEFQQHSGLGDVLSHLDENPLPTVFVVQPKESVDNPDKLNQLQARIAAYPVVDNVQLDLGWLRRLHELLALGERIVFALASLLALGVLLIIGNTLRLAIENRRDEIVVTKMVGGTNGFVRRPFLYTGVWYGLGGGLLAAVLLLVMGLWLSNPVNNLIYLYNSDYSMQFVSLGSIAALLFISAVLGWAGAWLAVSRHLKGVEPS